MLLTINLYIAKLALVKKRNLDDAISIDSTRK